MNPAIGGGMKAVHDCQRHASDQRVCHQLLWCRTPAAYCLVPTRVAGRWDEMMRAGYHRCLVGYVWRSATQGK